MGSKVASFAFVVNDATCHVMRTEIEKKVAEEMGGRLSACARCVSDTKNQKRSPGRGAARHTDARHSRMTNGDSQSRSSQPTSASRSTTTSAESRLRKGESTGNRPGILSSSSHTYTSVHTLSSSVYITSARRVLPKIIIQSFRLSYVSSPTFRRSKLSRMVCLYIHLIRPSLV